MGGATVGTHSSKIRATMMAEPIERPANKHGVRPCWSNQIRAASLLGKSKVG